MKTQLTKGYVHRIKAAYEKHPGSSEVFVAHDKWCKIYNGKECNCFPNITIKTPDDVFSIDHDGIRHIMPLPSPPKA